MSVTQAVLNVKRFKTHRGRQKAFYWTVNITIGWGGPCVSWCAWLCGGKNVQLYIISFVRGFFVWVIPLCLCHRVFVTILCIISDSGEMLQAAFKFEIEFMSCNQQAPKLIEKQKQTLIQIWRPSPSKQSLCDATQSYQHSYGTLKSPGSLVLSTRLSVHLEQAGKKEQGASKWQASIVLVPQNKCLPTSWYISIFQIVRTGELGKSKQDGVCLMSNKLTVQHVYTRRCRSRATRVKHKQSSLQAQAVWEAAFWQSIITIMCPNPYS